MKLNEKFTFGLYNNLTLLEVYQGTPKINKTLLKNYLIQCYEGINRPIAFLEFDFIDQIVIREGEIAIFPDNTFDESKEPGLDNLVKLGNMSDKLTEYFKYFFNINWGGMIESFEKFNSKNGQYVLGGNPEYVKWCIKENLISLETETLLELESKEVYRIKGIEIREINLNRYSFLPIIVKDFFRF